MNILLIDDEKLARNRLQTLLGQIQGVASCVEAASAIQALDILEKIGANHFDAILLDIQMPGMDGMSFAQIIKKHTHPPAIIFVTAHADYACNAFDLQAADYLTKPVRLERLEQALRRAHLLQETVKIPVRTSAAYAAPHALNAPNCASDSSKEHAPNNTAGDNPLITLTERGRIEQIKLHDICYCKAEQKYVTLHMAHSTRIYDGSLNDLEAQYPAYFLRIHRSTLVAKKEIHLVEKSSGDNADSHWVLRLHHSNTLLPISRRLLSAVKAQITGCH